MLYAHVNQLCQIGYCAIMTAMSQRVPYIQEPDVQTGQIWCESSGLEWVALRQPAQNNSKHSVFLLTAN